MRVSEADINENSSLRRNLVSGHGSLEEIRLLGNVLERHELERISRTEALREPEALISDVFTDEKLRREVPDALELIESFAERRAIRPATTAKLGRKPSLFERLSHNA